MGGGGLQGGSTLPFMKPVIFQFFMMSYNWIYTAIFNEPVLCKFFVMSLNWLAHLNISGHLHGK